MTDMLYTDEAWCAARDVIGDRSRVTATEKTTAVLDAVAPLIAAKALRDAAADYWQRTDVRSTFEGWSWLKDRADEIERGAS